MVDPVIRPSLELRSLPASPVVTICYGCKSIHKIPAQFLAKPMLDTSLSIERLCVQNCSKSKKLTVQLQTAYYSQVFCVSTRDLLNFTKAMPFYRAGPVEAWNTSTLVNIDHELLQSAQRIRDVDEALVRRMFGPLDVDTR